MGLFLPGWTGRFSRPPHLQAGHEARLSVREDVTGVVGGKGEWQTLPKWCLFYSWSRFKSVCLSGMRWGGMQNICILKRCLLSTAPGLWLSCRFEVGWLRSWEDQACSLRCIKRSTVAIFWLPQEHSSKTAQPQHICWRRGNTVPLFHLQVHRAAHRLPVGWREGRNCRSTARLQPPLCKWARKKGLQDFFFPVQADSCIAWNTTRCILATL